MKRTRKIALILAATMALGTPFSVSAAGLKDVFNADYYAGQYQDLQEAFGNNEKALYQHFLTYGIKEGRNASPVLNVLEYKEKYQDLQDAFGDDLDAYVNHYFTYGIKEGRDSGTDFNPDLYIKSYPDIENAFGDDYKAVIHHYLTYGIKEGRTKGNVIEVDTNTSKGENTTHSSSSGSDNNKNQTSGNDGTGSEAEKPNVPDTDMSEAEKPNIPDTNMSEAEKWFWSLWPGLGKNLITNATDIPYVSTPYGEDWMASVDVYCDKNDEKKYVSIYMAKGHDESKYYTTYEVYSQWAEGYKAWISETEVDFCNKYWMYIILNPDVMLGDGTVVPPEDFPGWDWNFD